MLMVPGWDLEDGVTFDVIWAEFEKIRDHNVKYLHNTMPLCIGIYPDIACFTIVICQVDNGVLCKLWASSTYLNSE